MHLPGFELETSRSVVLLHLHLTTQAIVAKHRIFLVAISYWSQTPLAKTLIYSYLRGYLVHGLLFSNVDFKMASCADETVFYEKLDALKASSKGKQSQTTLFISDNFYDNAKIWLRQDEGSFESMSKKDIATLKRRQWTLYQGKVQDKNGRTVIPKRELFKILTDAHSAIAHRGRDKTDHYVRERYAGINQEVTELFVSLCTLHQSQRSVTSFMKKPVIKPIAADSFLKHVEIDLTDFRNLPCSCSSSHKWVLHINDHYSKYSWLIPLKSKTCEEVVQALQNVFFMFGFPHTLHSDNGKEFTGQKMKDFCKTNSITQVHGASRTPTTQGLVERGNRTFKENLSNILREKKAELNSWCGVLGEAAYKKNITIHAATKQIPYVAVFGTKPWKETNNNGLSTEDNDETTIVTPSSSSQKRQLEEQSEQRKKMQKTVNENQEQYNAKMKQARKTKTSFKVGDIVAIKIDKVDKTSPLHPNVLIGKVLQVENNYTKVVTRHGIISTFISTNRLNKCTATNNVFDYSKEIAFSSACKQEMNYK